MKKKISDEINLILNCVIRKDAKIFEFTNDLRKKSLLILYLLMHMNHQNIKRIKIPDTFVSCYMDNYNKEFNYGIFNGLPKFNELVINIDYNYNEKPNYDKVYNRFMKSINFLDNILDGLSKKKNGTLILQHLNGDYNKIVRFIKMICEVTQKYNVKLKCECSYYFNKSKRKKRTIISLEKCSLPTVRSHITSINSLRITFSLCYSIFNSLKYFENLEKLHLCLTNIDIKKVFEKRMELNDNYLSLGNCKKLKDVEIYFEPIRKTNNEKNLEILYNNMKIIASMMPKTVETLKLTCMDYLTKEVTETINQFMPNIKLFVTQNVSFKDLDCLSSFKHLQAFIYNQNYPIHIPGTVKLIGICSNYIHNGGHLEIITIDQELINTYSKRFSKQLSRESKGYIPFPGQIQHFPNQTQHFSIQFQHFPIQFQHFIIQIQHFPIQFQQCFNLLLFLIF
uniref:F-box domain-containing protein n=1 Tax=Strongyloides papillosus TaxID=174720 RepID=A0A0N5BQH8_STREA